MPSTQPPREYTKGGLWTYGRVYGISRYDPTQRNSRGGQGRFVFDKFARTTAAPRVIKYTMPYICVYSSHPIPAGLMTVDATGAQVIPNYQPLHTLQDTFQGRQQINVMVNYLADINAELAVAAALNSSGALNGSYLSIFPWVPDHYVRLRHHLKGKNAMHIRGASMGAAVLAAVTGMPSVLYTGYTKNFGTSGTTVAVRVPGL